MKEQPQQDFLLENKLQNSTDWSNCTRIYFDVSGGSDDPNVYSDAIFNFRRIRLAPTTVLIGFGITVYAILKNPKKV
jgi:hypothetical protein